MTDTQPQPIAASSARRRVVVAMSGGVDSSVAAALLKRAGHDVVGVTLQLYDHGAATGRKGGCCAGQDIHDARARRRSARHSPLRARLRGPLRAKVIDRSPKATSPARRRSRASRATSEIKFHDLLETAQDLGADVLATGHYVQRARGPARPRARTRRRPRSRPELFPVRHHARAARVLVVSARRHAKGRECASGRATSICPSPKVRQPGHLLRADRTLH